MRLAYIKRMGGGLPFLIFLSVFLLFWIPGIRAEAGDIYTSPYVSFSPDGRAWTANAGDRNYTWYQTGLEVNTGIPSTLRMTDVGEHYYKTARTGAIPVGRWEVTYRTGTCIHNDYPPKGTSWHGISFGREKCFGYYYSGWNAHCADCGDAVSDMLMYMSREAAASIHYLEAGTGMDYYYLCPWCSNLEMGSGIVPHQCSAISWNRYKVHYDANTVGLYGGYMADSIHMYNNASEYEGNPVTPITCLTENAYSRTGYEFVGWNTLSDGSGTAYGDGAEIWNLTAQNYTPGSGEGIVTLYAQWRPSISTLLVDPNGGMYGESRDVTGVTMEHLSVYAVDSAAVTPPAGSRVSFQTNGGSAIEPVVGTQHFSGWSMGQPFVGRFREGKYFFTAPDGNVDTMTAQYVRDAVVLPSPEKEGSSFGGWYYDPDFEEPAGGAGEEIVPARDMTLYAQWVELKLYAVDNYRANNGKGAVDLSWSQPDGKNKVYLLYQGREKQDWTHINSASDIDDHRNVSETYGYQGTADTYTAPLSGIYTITAEGAQGGDYGEHKGGAGGRVTAKVWLSAGEKITYQAGGRDGRNGGGSGNEFGGGGDCTTVSTDRKGILIVAGGGGGATSLEDGESGGLAEGLRQDGVWTGADGQAGGGAGGIGGNAGEVHIHHHAEECYRDVNRNILSEYNSLQDIYTEVYERDDDEFRIHITRYGSQMEPIPINGADVLELEVVQGMQNGHRMEGNSIEDSYLAVYDQNGTQIFYAGGGVCEKYGVSLDGFCEFDDDGEAVLTDELLSWGTRGNPEHWIHYDDEGAVIGSSNDYTYVPDVNNPMEAARMLGGTTLVKSGSEWFYSLTRAYTEKFTIPAGTTGIYIVSSVSANAFLQNTFHTALLSGERQLICGYGEGQLLSGKPAYGGNNYVNTGCCISYSEEAGVSYGEGSVSIRSEIIGFQEELKLDGVTATDMAPPDAVSIKSVTKTALGGSQVQVDWVEPGDNGTVYYHMAESYLTGSTVPLCSSNTTMNTLVSGVAGYYYRVDEDAAAIVSGENGIFCGEPKVCIEFGKESRYLHVAAVDKAGNIGATTHISLSPDVKWNLYTKLLHIGDGSNVFPAAGKGSYYVRCDGETPFLLNYRAYTDGVPNSGYQPNYAVFEEWTDGNKAQNILRCESSMVQEELNNTELNITVEKEALSFSAAERTMLAFYPFTEAVRRNGCHELEIAQKFTLDKGADGREIELIPIVGADYGDEVVYSDHDRDEKNGIVIIGDGEAPVFHGLEPLEQLNLIDRSEGDISLEITAEDRLSGVDTFYLEIVNWDNMIQKAYRPDSDGCIRVDITEDEPIFSGDFTVSAYAVDHVGNERMLTYGTTEFALQADVERILEPHEPIFQCGESGILRFSVWGYADRVEVEFPEEMTEYDSGLNRTYEYTDAPQFCHTEEQQFMVPLDTPENNNFVITVRAYKGDRKLEEHPAISIVGVEGTILDDVRTRLR